jgi:hypothetical protein
MNFEGFGMESPDFFMIDPLTTMSLQSMDLSNRIWKHFRFAFMPCVLDKAYPSHLQFSKQNFPSELLAGTSITKLHVQAGGTPPPPSMLRKDKGTPIFRTSIMGASLMIFRLGILLICHLHLPITAKGEIINEHVKDRLFYVLFNELRLLRVPTEFHISIDDLPFDKEIENPAQAYMLRMKETANKIPSFLPPNDRCDILTQNFEDEKVEICNQYCPCLLCMRTYNPLIHPASAAGMVSLFRGDINTLVGQEERPPRLKPPDPVPFSPASADWKRRKAVISNFTATEEEDDFDLPLDPLGMSDDTEISKFLGTCPESDEEDDDSPTKPQPVKSDRTILKNPPIGIPDSFTPGEWREHYDISKPDIPENIRSGLADLLDEFKNLLSCHSTDCRPILVDGEPAVVDIKLTTDKPIFTKPYPMASRMSEVLDKKIEEMLDRGEICQVTSPYNMPVLLTHHNAENKHIPFEERKWRIVLDVRSLNSHMVLKNMNSHLVKGIEFLYPKLQGMMFVSLIDMRKAYRSLIASFFTRLATAFRTPSSAKYPYETWAFISTCDGLANLPGDYSLFVQKAFSPRSRQCTIQHIDDILVFSKDAETHLEDLRSVFTDLLKSNFLISIGKFQAFMREVTFLGHVMDGRNIWIPEDRKSYFDALKPPTTKKEMQSLLGISGYMSHFVDSYHLKTGLLFEALKGKTDKQAIVLTEPQLKAFEELKLSIKNAEKLHLVDFRKPIYMETDACFAGTGSVLYQETDNPNEPLRPKRNIIRYGSRRFSLTESLHHTSLEKEAMAILIAAKTNYYYLFNCTEAIIKTDLKSLITLLSCYTSTESARMTRLSNRL